MRVYKATTIQVQEDGSEKYISLWPENKYRLEYAVGVTTLPEFGYLFAFRNYHSISNYLKQPELAVFEAEAEEAEEVVHSRRWCWEEAGEGMIDVRDFWKRGLAFMDSHAYPKQQMSINVESVVMCKSITLIERLTWPY